MNMEEKTMVKTITVKGIGKATAKPDYVEISMELESNHKNYDKAMSIAADNIQRLTETLCGIGFEKESLKTTNFDVDTDYDRVQDYNGHYKSVFVGYEVTHYLKLGSTKERLEKEILEENKKLLAAKTENLQSAKRIEELYTNAIAAMKRYSGHNNEEEPEDY